EGACARRGSSWAPLPSPLPEYGERESVAWCSFILLGAAGGEMIGEDGDEDEDALDGALPVGGGGAELQEDQGAADDREQDDGEEGAEDSSAAAGDGGSADDDGGDDEQLPAGADVDVDDTELRDADDGGDGDEQAGERED